MIAYAIVVEGDSVSEKGYKNLVTSSKSVGNKFKVMRFNAITPDNVEQKDINDMILKGGYSREHIISMIEKNTYEGMEAMLEISRWRKA